MVRRNPKEEKNVTVHQQLVMIRIGGRLISYPEGIIDKHQQNTPHRTS